MSSPILTAQVFQIKSTHKGANDNYISYVSEIHTSVRGWIRGSQFLQDQFSSLRNFYFLLLLSSAYTGNLILTLSLYTFLGV